MSDHSRTGADRPGALERLLGDKPAGVILRLLLVSLLVGFLLNVFGIDIDQLLTGTVTLFRDTLRDGAGTLRSMGGYILTGAVLVVPIWVLMRLSRKR